jgi:hypothetical protein
MIKVKENLDRLEVLSEIYNDLSNNIFTNKKDLDIAKLKMQLIKKEILLLNFIIDKEIS